MFFYEDGVPYEDMARLRLIVNIQKPLIPEIHRTKDDRWVQVKYEKLTGICKYCGFVNHYEDECVTSVNLEEIPIPVEMG